MAIIEWSHHAIASTGSYASAKVLVGKDPTRLAQADVFGGAINVLPTPPDATISLCAIGNLVGNLWKIAALATHQAANEGRQGIQVSCQVALELGGVELVELPANLAVASFVVMSLDN